METNATFQEISDNPQSECCNEEEDNKTDSLFSDEEETLVEATKMFGMCGNFWECNGCQFWCFKYGDMRKHEASGLCQAERKSPPKTDDCRISIILKDYWNCRYCIQVASNRQNASSQEDVLKSRKEFRTRRKGKIRAKAKKTKGVCGSLSRCAKCSFWDYSQRGVKNHQLMEGHS